MKMTPWHRFSAHLWGRAITAIFLSEAGVLALAPNDRHATTKGVAGWEAPSPGNALVPSDPDLGRGTSGGRGGARPRRRGGEAPDRRGGRGARTAAARRAARHPARADGLPSTPRAPAGQPPGRGPHVRGRPSRARRGGGGGRWRAA